MASATAQILALKAAQPPGTGNIITLLNWGAWGVTIACIAGILTTAAVMAVSHHRGSQGGEHMGRLGLVLLACVLGSAAQPIIAAIT